ncbi:hypothetical protein MJO48_13010 [Dickeya fangzhongdai]|uniref:hypothetical protein n=1 Tax=Dickeya fangzhongdai TaxID=1778540 RepID=UPI001EFA8BA5|nr:hypothetical protein [Dickeya fangzhongdai]ULR29427.1 hypothetical protein MJO48_13010 [Dickeya fangzhongdai]
MTARTMNLDVNVARLTTNGRYSTCAAVNKDVVIRIPKDYEVGSVATVYSLKRTRYRYVMGIKSM